MVHVTPPSAERPVPSAKQSLGEPATYFAIHTMSRRVTVVLSQGQRLGAERQHREDQLIAALLMHPLAEATIISDLTEIDSESTDRLCLESISGIAIVLAWHPPQKAAEVFTQIGITARLLNHPATTTDTGQQDTTAVGRALSLHYFDLNEPESPEFYLDRIAQVAEEVAVTPVTLTNLVSGRDVPLATSEPNSNNSLEVVSRPSAIDHHHDHRADDREDGDKLDDLMDALDRVDL